ncbi:unnamed protein product, partial [Closterium sp. NIES-54]
VCVGAGGGDSGLSAHVHHVCVRRPCQQRTRHHGAAAQRLLNRRGGRGSSGGGALPQAALPHLAQQPRRQ